MKTQLISLLATWAKDAGIVIVSLICRVNGCSGIKAAILYVVSLSLSFSLSFTSN